MEEKNWLQAFEQKNQIGKVLDTNQYTEKYGLVLSEKEAQLIVSERTRSLKEQKRVEFGNSILPEIIYEFCDSAYITQDNYTATLIRLQEIFYLYKNEMLDEISDKELLQFMKEQFETICYGDLEYLETTCLAIFAQAIRAGYDDYRKSEGRGAYEQFDEVPRWDRELYQEVLTGLCWR